MPQIMGRIGKSEHDVLSCVGAGPPLYRGDLAICHSQGEGASVEEPGARRPAATARESFVEKKAFLGLISQ